MENNIEISIIIPCYNSGKYLPDTIKSIDVNHPLMNNIEVIVIDDGSTEEYTLQVLKELPNHCQVFYKKNGGPASARNYGIERARGKYILTLDSDNLVKMEYLVIAKEILDNFPNISVVYAKPIFWGSEVCKNMKWHEREHSLLELVKHNYIDTCSIFRKTTWEMVGGFDESPILIGHEDWEFWLRIALKTNTDFYYINRPLFYYRVKESNSVTISYNSYGSNLTRKFTYLYPIRRNLLKKIYEEAKISNKEYKKTLGEMTGYLSMMHFHNGSFSKGICFLLMNTFLIRYRIFEFIKGSLYWLKTRFQFKMTGLIKQVRNLTVFHNV